MNLKQLHENAEAQRQAKITGKDPEIAILRSEVSSLKSQINSLIINVAESDNALRIYQKKMNSILKKMSRGVRLQQAELNDISLNQQTSDRK